MRPSGITPKWDGITREGIDREAERRFLYALYDGICQGCGEPLAFDEMEIAHCIADTKANKHKYGKWVINSKANKRPTHRGRCNSRMNCAGNPAKCSEIVELAKLERGRE